MVIRSYREAGLGQQRTEELVGHPILEQPRTFVGKGGRAEGWSMIFILRTI
jgi:hypothetical protein